MQLLLEYLNQSLTLFLLLLFIGPGEPKMSSFDIMKI